MKNLQPYKYILRYLIDPAFHADDRIDELVDFCQASRIGEVMLFITAEELSAGHPTRAEWEAYAELGKSLSRRLGEVGVDLSLNPWSTLYHDPRGRILREGQSFQCMVGESGYTSPLNACPLCPAWQQWLSESFAYLAREIKPVAIWVEDDWRLHNHGPQLGWGGCFCSLHLQRLAKSVGAPEESVTRETVLQHVLAPGSPHPWRAKWLEISRDSMLEPARKLRHAIAEACPSTRIGLMSSAPDTHSVEDRDWHALQDAFGTTPAFLTRPNMPPYSEATPLTATPSNTRHTLANLKRPIEVYPELECAPRNGPYSKSAAYCVWQCYHAASLGSQGITINHYDMMGNGIALDPKLGEALSQHKDRLDALTALQIDDQNAQGLQVLFSPRVARFRHHERASGLFGLINSSLSWCQASYILGIAHGLVDDVPSNHAADGAAPMAVSDQTLRAFDDDAIRRLLSGPVLLDAVSVEILLQRGFGDMIGVASASWQMLDEVGYSYEQIREDDSAVYGLCSPRMTAQTCSTRLLAMQVTDVSEVRTDIRRADHTRCFPGMVVHRNAQGGRVAMIAYPFDGGYQTDVSFYTVFRRRLLQRLLFEFSPKANLMTCDSHPMHVYRVPTSNGLLMALFNPNYDPVQHPVLSVPTGQLDSLLMYHLDAKGQWRTVSCQVVEHGDRDDYIVPFTLHALEACFLLAKKV